MVFLFCRSVALPDTMRTRHLPALVRLQSSALRVLAMTSARLSVSLDPENVGPRMAMPRSNSCSPVRCLDRITSPRVFASARAWNARSGVLVRDEQHEPVAE